MDKQEIQKLLKKHNIMLRRFEEFCADYKRSIAKEIFKELDPYFKNHVARLKIIEDYPKIKARFLKNVRKW